MPSRLPGCQPSAMDALSAVAFLGLVLFVVGVLLLGASFLPSQVPNSRKAAVWMMAIGAALCLACVVFVVWLAIQVGS